VVQYLLMRLPYAGIEEDLTGGPELERGGV
jgi:hypothetical protein